MIHDKKALPISVHSTHPLVTFFEVKCMNDCGVRFIIQGLDINTSFRKSFFSNKVFHDKCQTFFILNYQDCRSYQLISNLISNQNIISRDSN